MQDATTTNSDLRPTKQFHSGAATIPSAGVTPSTTDAASTGPITSTTFASDNGELPSLDIDNVGKGIRNFRHSTDIESFYRFIHEHDLRREAKTIFDRILSHIQKSKKRKKGKIQ